MILATTATVVFPHMSARWTSRVAFFSAALLISAVVLHRLFAMPTPIALNLFKVAFAGAVLSLVLAALAIARLWQEGGIGRARVIAGIVTAFLLLLWPLIYLPTVLELPTINDVTTDRVDPPRFEVLARSRSPGANSADYPGQSFAVLQARAYPDLEGLRIRRSVVEAFALSADALRRLGLTIVREQPPDLDSGQPGLIEAVDQTLIMGFLDDVVVRVMSPPEGERGEARIDVRSASRYGQHDLGQNAERLRRILKEIVVRLQSTVPAAPAANITLKSLEERTKLKQKGGDRKKGGRRKPLNRDQ